MDSEEEGGLLGTGELWDDVVEKAGSLEEEFDIPQPKNEIMTIRVRKNTKICFTWSPPFGIF